MDEQQSAYERAIARLIVRVRQMVEPWNSTERRKAITDFAKRLNDLASDLEMTGSAQDDIELEHDTEPPPEVGLDGYPTAAPDWGCRYAVTLLHMRTLAASATRAADSLPNPRKRIALPSAALALVYLRHEYGFDQPRLSDGSPDVQELSRVCEAAGIFKANETLRNALSVGLESFDPHYTPPWVQRVIDGG